MVSQNYSEDRIPPLLDDSVTSACMYEGTILYPMRRRDSYECQTVDYLCACVLRRLCGICIISSFAYNIKIVICGRKDYGEAVVHLSN